MEKDNMITLPVVATMRLQPDGSFKMVEAEYITVSADVVARFLLDRFHVSAEKAVEP